MSSDSRADWGNDDVDVEYQDGVGYTTHMVADDLRDYEFDGDTEFVRWHPWGDERAGDDVWHVKERSWKYTVSWIRDRDDPPLREDHRIYTLMNRETWDEIDVSERELQRGEWKPLAEVE